MPQMSPLLWCALFLTFSCLFIVTLIKIYFFSSKNLKRSSSSEVKTSLNTLNWMW